MSEMSYRPTRSGTIVAVGYDARDSVLGVVFRGGATYHHLRCPREHYDEMLSRSRRGESVGGYYHASVRDRYQTQRVGVVASSFVERAMQLLQELDLAQLDGDGDLAFDVEMDLEEALDAA